MALSETSGLNMPDRFKAIESALKGDGDRCVDFTNKVNIITGSGVPVDGTTGKNSCGIGSIYLDYTATSAKAYINTGSLSSPTWTVVGAQLAD